MALDKIAFEQACGRFRKQFPDFKDFGSPGEGYRKEERDYKDELLDLYGRRVEPLVADGPPSQFLDAYLGILRCRLETMRGPQNLVGWRALTNLDGQAANKAEIGSLLQDVLRDADGDSAPWSAAIDRYGRNANEQLKNPWRVRQFLAVLLMLHRPKRQVSLTIQAWNDSSKMLAGKAQIKHGSVVTGAEVSRCLAFAREVKRSLEDAGWRPRDMIDVQSFLWVIVQRDQITQPIGAGEPGNPTLEEIGEEIESHGMRIEDRTLRRYHYALQSRGIVILAGPSGTGKTWLTKLYANAVRAEYEVAPVAPNWAANEDLLGYFNPIEKAFHATPFLEFIDRAAKAWDEHKEAAPDFHLVLDEMNLARVEHYFSLFLSLMETRRDGYVPVTNLAGGRSVRIPPNLKFAGTVNMDETTHGFADKVFDRAQLIELQISRPAVEAHLADAPYSRDLLDLWDAMEGASPVGFRVLDDIGVDIELAGKDDVKWESALDEQIVSKLLPKLRGIEPASARALERVNSLVQGRFPLAASKCESMILRHQVSDVVSFF